jgi:crossover junction endodeoxyribonuclease RuvC
MGHQIVVGDILGVDPGLASCGWAVLRLTDQPEVVGMGVIRTMASSKKQHILAVEDNVRRTRQLAEEISKLLAHPTFLVGAEAMSFPRSASSSGKLCLCWGALVGLLQARNLPLVQTSPRDIKRRITGNGSASKEDVEKALRKRFAVTGLLTDVPRGQHNHAFDALGAAVAAMDSDIVRAALSMSRR